MARRPTQSDYNRFYLTARERSRRLQERLVLGLIALLDWEQEFKAFLVDRHTQAAFLGRRRGGDLTPLSDADSTFGTQVAEEQYPFLSGFVADIEGGKYGEVPGGKEEPGSLSQDALEARAALYVKRLLGTANEAFAATAATGETFDWLLGGNEDHCPDCPERAAGGPYTLDSLPGFPSDGSTACLVNCLCFLKRSDGASGFLAPVDTPD